MKLFRIAVPLSMVCWAFTANGQLPIPETQNLSEAQPHKQSGSAQDVNVLMGAVQQASEFGESDPRYEAALRNLAGFYCRAHSYAEAESLYKHALVVSEKVHGAQHEETATLLNDLALMLQEEARFPEAQAFLQRALAIREVAFGSGSPLTATSLNNLASVYSSEGHYSEAETLYKRALAIWEKFEPEELNLATTLDNLASVEQDLGKYSQAEEH